MPIDLAGLYEAIMAGLGKVPSALIAAALLAGPTVIWMIARFINPPDLGTTEEIGFEEILWICPKCRSINEDRIDVCYRCHRLRPDESVPLVIEPAQTRSGPGVGIAVGPGRPVLQPRESWVEREVAHASGAAADRAQAEEDLPAAELAPLTFEPLILMPRVKASGRPSASEPAGRRGRRKPPGAGDASPTRTRKSGSG